MNIRDLQQSWNEFGERNPMWAVLTDRTDWESDEFFATGAREIETVLRSLGSVHVLTERGRALDFGCGVGRLSQALADHFDEVDGVDIAPSMVDQARKINRHPHRVTYHLNERNDLLMFRDNTFDFVYSNITLQHMRPAFARRYIVEFLRVLRPGGVSVFQLPSDLVEPNTLKRALRRLLPEEMIIAYRVSRDNLRRIWNGADRRPTMEMYGIGRNEVVRLVEGNGGRSLQVEVDRRPTANPAWECFQYTVAK